MKLLDSIKTNLGIFLNRNEQNIVEVVDTTEDECLEELGYQLYKHPDIIEMNKEQVDSVMEKYCNIEEIGTDLLMVMKLEVEQELRKREREVT